MRTALENHLISLWPTSNWAGLTVLIGVSGGPDSLALAHCLHRNCPTTSTLVIGHFNHGLRGKESDDDEEFVRSIAGKLNCEFLSGKQIGLSKGLSGDSKSQGFAGGAGPRTFELAIELGDYGEECSDFGGEERPKSLDEASLRRIRYKFFAEAARHCGARYLAIGHTADDRVETTLYNLMRGTGLSGIVGIRPFRSFDGDLVLTRPLLTTTRQEVLDFLRQFDIEFRTDSSNLESHYTRNRIRQELLPLIESIVSPSAKAAIVRASELVGETQEMIEILAAPWIEKFSSESTLKIIRIQLSAADQIHWPVMQEVLRKMWIKRDWNLQAMSYLHWQSLRKLVQTEKSAQNGPCSSGNALTLPGNIDARIETDQLVIRCSP